MKTLEEVAVDVASVNNNAAAAAATTTNAAAAAAAAAVAANDDNTAAAAAANTTASNFDSNDKAFNDAVSLNQEKPKLFKRRRPDSLPILFPFSSLVVRPITFEQEMMEMEEAAIRQPPQQAPPKPSRKPMDPFSAAFKKEMTKKLQALQEAEDAAINAVLEDVATPPLPPRRPPKRNTIVVRSRPEHGQERLIGYEEASLAPLLDHLCQEQARFKTRLNAFRLDMRRVDSRIEYVNDQLEQRLYSTKLMVGIVTTFTCACVVIILVLLTTKLV